MKNVHLAITIFLLGASSVASAQTVIGLDVTGPQANAGKQERCMAVAQRGGYVINPGAPVRATLVLERGFNRLQIVSARRGEVLNVVRPGWGMEQLCQDALQQASNALMSENSAPAQYAPPPPQYAPPQYAQPSAGSTPMIAFDITGPQANPGKQERCMRVAQQRGFVVNPSSPVRVMLILQPGFNRLQITSARRGEVYNQTRPGWGMEQLCEDALRTAEGVLAQENAAPPPQAQYVPPQSPTPRPRAVNMALGPIPSGASTPANVKAIVDGGIKAWQAAQFDVALQAFTEAHRISHDPQFLFDMAVCEQRIGRLPDATRHVQLFIDGAPTSPYKPYGEQLFGELQAAQGMD